MQRVVFLNGTIIIQDPTTGDYTYEVEPQSYFEEFSKVWIDTCSYVLYDNVNELKTKVFCPPNVTATPRELAYTLVEETKYRDGTMRRVFFNGTIARFNQ